MKIYKYLKNARYSNDDFVYIFNHLPSLNASVFKSENFKPSSGCINSLMKR